MRRLFKKQILEVTRIRTSRGRDLSGLRLDRNERVSCLPEAIVQEIFRQFKPWDLAAHPEPDAFRQKAAAFVGVTPEQIYILNGITEGIRILFETLCTPTNNVVVLDPTYPMYRVWAQLAGVEYRPFTYDERLVPDHGTLDASLDGNTAMVMVPNPNLPVESAFTLEELSRIALRCEQNGTALVVDEAYHHFGTESAVGLLARHPNLLVMRTFSKAFGLASIRLGYAVGSAENIAYLSQTRGLVESNTLSLGLGSYMLNHLDIVETHVQEVKNGANYLHEELTKTGVRWHGGLVTNGMLIFLDGPEQSDSLIRFLADRKIYVRGGFGSPFDGAIRVTIGAEYAMREFIAAFRQWRGQRP
ncbi:MAG: histidinol-phosphate transaminase [Proteobacteria bacterium]|nr:histidinol-phosphate transaminase [Pseudomonadota bacterium]